MDSQVTGIISLHIEDRRATPETRAREGLIYLASPYTDESRRVREIRYERACEEAGKYMRMGYLIFSPIAHTHGICVHNALPYAFDFWEKYDRACLEACSQMWILTMPGWQGSRGITREREICKELGKQVWLKPFPALIPALNNL